MPELGEQGQPGNSSDGLMPTIPSGGAVIFQDIVFSLVYQHLPTCVLAATFWFSLVDFALSLQDDRLDKLRGTFLKKYPRTH